MPSEVLGESGCPEAILILPWKSASEGRGLPSPWKSLTQAVSVPAQRIQIELTVSETGKCIDTQT